VLMQVAWHSFIARRGSPDDSALAESASQDPLPPTVPLDGHQTSSPRAEMAGQGSGHAARPTSPTPPLRIPKVWARDPSVKPRQSTDQLRPPRCADGLGSARATPTGGRKSTPKATPKERRKRTPDASPQRRPMATPTRGSSREGSRRTTALPTLAGHANRPSAKATPQSTPKATQSTGRKETAVATPTGGGSTEDSRSNTPLATPLSHISRMSAAEPTLKPAAASYADVRDASPLCHIAEGGKELATPPPTKEDELTHEAAALFAELFPVKCATGTVPPDEEGEIAREPNVCIQH